MRERDRDLLAALAEGRLEDESEARALIESSEEARVEYETQRAALDALGQVGPAIMTEAEKAALHRDLWTHLRSGGAPTRATPWLSRWSFVAAGLLLVVGLAAVISQTNFPESAGVALESADRAEELATATTELAGAAAAPEASLAPQADEESIARAATADRDFGLLAEIAEQVRAGEPAAELFDYAYTSSPKQQTITCLEEAGLADYIPIGAVQGENRYLVAVPANQEIGPSTPIFFVDADTCVVVYVDE